MNVDLAYHKATLSLTIPDSVTIDIFAPMEVATSYSPDRFRQDFLAAGGQRLLDMSHPVLVVNDAFRNTPTPVILDWLNQVDGEFLDRVRVVIATGTHGLPSDEGMETIFGGFLPRLRGRVHVHDATDQAHMTNIGEDGFGEEVWLDTGVYETDIVAVIGSVEPHYFAGYTGGRKGVFPGITDQATVERNHNLANSLKAAPMRLDGNPVAEHLEQLMSLLDAEKFFGIQMVHDTSGRIQRVYMGQLEQAFRSALPDAGSMYSAAASEPYDTVVCEVRPPLDRNLYQLQKALENNQSAVADGGEIILISACAEGIGSSFFYELAGKWDHDANQPHNGTMHFGSHKLSRVNKIARRIDVRLKCELDADTVRHVFFEPMDNLNEHLMNRANRLGTMRLAVVRDAGNMVLSP